MQSRIPALEKQIWVDLVHPRIMKIVFCKKNPRLRASPRHGGQGVFYSHRSAAGAAPSGAAAFIVPDGDGGNKP